MSIFKAAESPCAPVAALCAPQLKELSGVWRCEEEMCRNLGQVPALTEMREVKV